MVMLNLFSTGVNPKTTYICDQRKLSYGSWDRHRGWTLGAHVIACMSTNFCFLPVNS